MSDKQWQGLSRRLKRFAGATFAGVVSISLLLYAVRGHGLSSSVLSAVGFVGAVLPATLGFLITLVCSWREGYRGG